MPLLQDPKSVAAQTTDPSLAGHIRQGLGLEGVLSDVGRVGKKVTRGGGKLADKLLGTASSGGSGPLLKGVSAVSEAVQRNPRAAIGTAVLAPILYNALQTSHARERDRLMNAYTSPYRDVIASVLEKTAAPATAPSSWSPNLQAYLRQLSMQSARKASTQTSKQTSSAARQAAQAAARAAVRKITSKPEPTFSVAGVGKGLAEGVGKGLGGLAAGLIGAGIGKGVDLLRDHFMLEPKRKELFERLLSSDPVLSDAVHRNPDAKGLLLEAYGTMTRFAPSLALDVNAVRSFLREAVLGGSGVNYATVKNLVDTERSISDSKSSGLPGVKL